MPENMLEFTLLPKAWQDWAVGLAWKAAGRTFGRAEAVTTPTRKAAQFLEKHTGLTDVHAISCGIDTHKYTPDWQPRTENRILFVGRVTGEKQIDVLLRALTLLPAELDAKVEIVGGGDQKRNLEHLAVELGIADRVTFTGYVTDDELREAYHRASVLAMPSIAELQSIVTMEAMASALPVVAANAMALPHLVHDGENGYLFEPGNPDDLAAKLRTGARGDARRVPRTERGVDPAHRRARHPAHDLDVREPVSWKAGDRPGHRHRAGSSSRVTRRAGR